MNRLAEKIAIITGASSGIGKQVAIRFAEEGAHLAICARREELLLETKAICEARGAKVLAKTVDIAEYDQLSALVRDTHDMFGRIDILVNNACNIGELPDLPPFETSPLSQLMVPINEGLVPTWHMMQLCIPLMKQHGGSIINVASSADDGGIGFAGYGAAKAAQSALTRAVALEVGKYNIRVNNLYPNVVSDKWTGESPNDPKYESMRAQVIETMSQNPFGRPGVPYDDAAPVFVFLASKDSQWITGQDISAEGGQIIHR